MLLKNGCIYDENFDPVKRDVLISDGKIAAIGESLSDDEIFDCTGLTVLPGFIDIHIHGCSMADASDADEKSIAVMSENLARRGVTSFCPTTMTLPFEDLKKAFENFRAYGDKEEGAYLLGVNMEGPYISLEKKGAQKAEYVRKPDIDEFGKLNDIFPIRLVDIAPECDENFAFAKEASKICTVSAAHTASDCETAAKGFKNGISHATHLFNAMTGISARNPGVAGAVLDSDSVTAEMICDGFHISPVVLRMAFKALGEDRTVVVSDSMKAAGCEDGDYELGGQTVYVRDGKALLADGTIAASTSNVFSEYLNLLSFGIDKKQALKSCTINPARAIGADSFTGSIKEGKNADLLVLDGENNIKAVFIKGKKMGLPHSAQSEKKIIF